MSTPYYGLKPPWTGLKVLEVSSDLSTVVLELNGRSAGALSVHKENLGDVLWTFVDNSKVLAHWKMGVDGVPRLTFEGCVGPDTVLISDTHEVTTIVKLLAQLIGAANES